MKGARLSLGFTTLLKLIAKKVFYTLFLFYLLVTLLFFLMRTLRGDPFIADTFSFSRDVLDSLKQAHRWDDSLYLQYLRYLHRIFIQWDWGVSFYHRDLRVSQILLLSLPLSLQLGFFSALFALGGGILLGIYLSLRQNHWFHHSLSFLLIFIFSLHPIFSTLVLRTFFSENLSLFPLTGPSPSMPLNLKWLYHATLPSLAMAISPAIYIAQLTQNSLLKILPAHYVKQAHARGICSMRIIFHYLLRNALVPLMASLRVPLTRLLTGGFVVEYCFNISGVSRWLIESIFHRDLPVTIGILFSFFFLFLAINLLAESLSFLLDSTLCKE